MLAEVPLYALEQRISDHLAGDAPGSRKPRHDSRSQVSSAKATRTLCPFQQAISNSSEVHLRFGRFTGVTPQQQPILRDQAVNALLVQPGKPFARTQSIEQCPDPSIPVRRSIISQSTDSGQHLCTLRLLILPLRATPFAKARVKLRARDTQGVPPPSSQRILVGQ